MDNAGLTMAPYMPPCGGIPPQMGRPGTATGRGFARIEAKEERGGGW